MQPENSPAELEFYRDYYAARMNELGDNRTTDFTKKSHLYEAIWIAASSPISIDEITQKIFETAFPEGEQEDREYPLYLYETAMGLADGSLEKEEKETLERGLKKLLGLN